MEQNAEAINSGETLYDVFYANLPQYRGKGEGKIDARKLSRDLNISFQALYKWFGADDGNGKIPPGRKRIGQLMELPGSTLTLEKLLPFTDVV